MEENLKSESHKCEFIVRYRRFYRTLGERKAIQKMLQKLLRTLCEEKYINYFVNIFNYKIIYNIFTSYMENTSLRKKTMLENIKEK